MSAAEFVKIFMYTGALLVGWLATSNVAHVSFRQAGWLDRVVEYHKQKFFADVKERLPPIGFSAKVIKAPENYVDSKKWDYESVVRLLTLLRANADTRPIFKSLRRSLSSGRRWYGMSKKESFNIFPNIDPANYYDSSNERDVADGAGSAPALVAGDDEEPGTGMDDDSILVITNPAEAKLPVSHVSVGVLREILTARAEAARVMPTTKQSWDWEDIFAKKRTTPGAGGATSESETPIGGETTLDPNSTSTPNASGG